MTEVTNKGRELALQLSPVIGTTRTIQTTCSLIARQATSHHRLQEQACNGYADASGNWSEVAEQRANQAEYVCEERIRELAGKLPEWQEDDGKQGPFGVTFGGDPRGCTVKLTGPESVYDSWGRDGVCVPQH